MKNGGASEEDVMNVTSRIIVKCAEEKRWKSIMTNAKT